MDEAMTQMKLRLPANLDRWVASQAQVNRRSKNAEVVVRLEAAMAAESRPLASKEEAGAALAG